jgi:simple sugar transport system ATP-binding protein
MNVLFGLYQPDEGEILLDGHVVRVRNPREAMRLGIAMIHQHFMLVDSLTVLENVALALPGQGFRLDRPALGALVRETAAEHGLAVDPDMPVWQLSVGEQQRVEILKALLLRARVLVLDEPTAVLTPTEAEDLARILREIRAAGRGVIYISHKLNEVMALCDRVTVLRKGRSEGTFGLAGIDAAELAARMVGRELPAGSPEDRACEPGTTVLRLDSVEVMGAHGRRAVRGVSLELRAHEILGVAGVAGNGQAELVEALAGLRPTSGGSVMLGGRDVTGFDAERRAALGVRHIPADRLGVGLIPSLPLTDNAILRRFRVPPVARGPWIAMDAALAHAETLVAAMDVRGARPGAAVRGMSGGNLQKLVVAREIADAPSLLLAEYPTRGLDPGAAEAVRAALLRERARGAAILLVSEDLDEILRLADRVVVMYEGCVMGIVAAAGADRAHVGLWMAGAQAPASQEKAP